MKPTYFRPLAEIKYISVFGGESKVSFRQRLKSKVRCILMQQLTLIISEDQKEKKTAVKLQIA